MSSNEALDYCTVNTLTKLRGTLLSLNNNNGPSILQQYLNTCTGQVPVDFMSGETRVVWDTNPYPDPAVTSFLVQKD